MSSSSRRPIRILHVDDDPDFADMAATFLEKENPRFTVETASSAAAGLEWLENEIDCIVSDYDMPEKNGIEFLEMVRAEWPDIPFILYTGKGSEEIASDAISAGVTDYLQKKTGSDQYTVLANRIENAVKQTRSQEALEASEQRLSLFFEQSPLGAIEWDENFNIVQVNDTATDILGYSAAELEGESWESIVGETDREHVGEVSQRLLDAEGGYQSTNTNQRKDGTMITCEWHNRVITDADGQTLSIFSKFQDITEQKEHERELQTRATAIESVTDGIAILDENQEYVFMNEAHAEMYGHESPEALLGDTWRACFDDIDISRFESEILPELFETGEWRGEMEVTTADGRNIVQDLLLNVTADGRVVCVVRDITEQKERQARLEQSTARFEALFEHSPDMINIHTADGTIVDVNQPFCEVFDQPEDALIGRKVWDIDQQLTAEELLEIWDRMEIGERIEVETEFRRDDGSEFPVAAHITRLPIEGGDRFMVISRDISERRHQETRLKALNETGQELMAAETREEVIDIGVTSACDILGLDANGICLYDDDSDELVPVTHTEAALELIPNPPPALGRDSIAWQVFKQGEPRAIANVANDPDVYNPNTALQSELFLPIGEYGILIASSAEAHAYDEEDIILGSLLAKTIAAALGHIESLDRLSEQKQELVSQNERLDQFTSMVSHDLRNPISIASGNLQLYRETGDGAKLDAVERSLQRIGDLTEDLLSIVQVSGQTDEYDTVSLTDVAVKAWEMTDTRSASLETQESTLTGDDGQLQALFENLFRNAVGHGGDAVTVRVGPLDNGFYVEDTGDGIPEGEREQVFEHGFSTGYGGSGVGLTVVSRIAQAHGWNVTLSESDEGGARFEFEV